MAEPFLPQGVEQPDFHIAAMGRSGSTMIANWLTSPPDQIVFLEPSFLAVKNTRLLKIQLANLGLAVTDDEWALEDESAQARFTRIMAPRLAGRQWAVKEVLCSEHAAILARLQPKRVLISVRNIVDVALSFFEKHRLQGNLERFSDQWVVDYCIREAAGLVKLRDELAQRSHPFEVVRYEDFTQSRERREQLAAFLGWRGGGSTDAHFDQFDRSFEVERHGSGISSRNRPPAERAVEQQLKVLAQTIADGCNEYQQEFGYKADNLPDINYARKLLAIQ